MLLNISNQKQYLNDPKKSLTFLFSDTEIMRPLQLEYITQEQKKALENGYSAKGLSEKCFNNFSVSLMTKIDYGSRQPWNKK